MISLAMSDKEKKCLHSLAKSFLAGEEWPGAILSEGMAEAGLEHGTPDHNTIMSLMEEYGAIDHAIHAGGSFYNNFHITAKAVLLDRQLEELERKANEPKDIVTQTTERARKHPLLGIAVYIIIVVAAVIAFSNQLAQFIANIKPIFAPPPPTKVEEPSPKSTIAPPPPMKQARD